MKKTAFLQALILFILLAGSWVLLMNRLRDDDKSVEGQPAIEAREVQVTGPDNPWDESPEAADEKPDRLAPAAIVPEGWAPWMEYLQKVESPEAMRTALQDLQAALYSLPDAEAIEQILIFLESGVDLKTGLAFQVGPGQGLIGAGYLRTLLLDWLHELDPLLAADLGIEALESTGTGMVADEYVIHMRNYAAGTTDPASVRDEHLKTFFRDMIEDQEWIREPGSAIAEAMDVAVHIRATEFVPQLSRFMQPEQPRQLRHASALALERLVDQEPLETLTYLLSEAGSSPALSKARAGYFARLDPALRGADALLLSYLRNPAVAREEAVLFLQSFPNLNQSRSHNLLSHTISITDPESYQVRFTEALRAIRQWRADPSLENLSAPIDEAAERLYLQFYGSPSP